MYGCPEGYDIASGMTRVRVCTEYRTWRGAEPKCRGDSFVNKCFLSGNIVVLKVCCNVSYFTPKTLNLQSSKCVRGSLLVSLHENPTKARQCGLNLSQQTTMMKT